MHPSVFFGRDKGKLADLLCSWFQIPHSSPRDSLRDVSARGGFESWTAAVGEIPLPLLCSQLPLGRYISATQIAQSSPSSYIRIDEYS